MKNNKKLKIIMIVAIVIVALIIEVIAIYYLFPVDEKKESNTDNQVSFDNSSYSCEVGNEIEVTVKVTDEDISKDISVVSNDISIATVDNKSLKCDNCKKVIVKCADVGNVKLKAMYNNKELATSSVSVTKKEVAIAFDQKFYKCRRGEVIETTIKVGEGRTASSIKQLSTFDDYVYSFQNPSSNSAKSTSINIVDIDENVSSPATCNDCKKIRIKCFVQDYHKDSYLLKAETVDGASVTSTIYVDTNPLPVHFTSSNPSRPPTTTSCLKNTTITLDSITLESNVGLKRIYAEDPNLVDIKTGNISNNKIPIQLRCKSEPGVTDVYLEADDGSISFLRISVINRDPPNINR